MPPAKKAGCVSFIITHKLFRPTGGLRYQRQLHREAVDKSEYYPTGWVE